MSPASQRPSGCAETDAAVTPGASPKSSDAAAPPATATIAPPFSFSPDAATRTAAPRLPSASTARYANTSRAVPEPDTYAARRIPPFAISASVGVPSPVSTRTGASNVTAASTVSPSL